MLDQAERDLENQALDDAYDAQGVDRSLIRKMLSLEPEERLRHIEAIVEDVMQIWEINDTRPIR